MKMTLNDAFFVFKMKNKYLKMYLNPKCTCMYSQIYIAKRLLVVFTLLHRERFT